MPSTYHIFYDDRCALCRRSRRLIERLATSSRLIFIDTHDAAAMAGYPAMTGKDVAGGMWVLDERGNLAGGYDGLMLLAPAYRLGWLLRPLLNRPFPSRLGRWLYAWISRHRHQFFPRHGCQTGACRV